MFYLYIYILGSYIYQNSMNVYSPSFSTFVPQGCMDFTKPSDPGAHIMCRNGSVGYAF